MTETINKPTSLCFFLPSLSTNRVVTSYHIGNLSPLWSLNLPFLLSSKTSHASYIDSKKFWGRLELNLPWKWNVKVKSLSHVWLFVTPWTVATRLLHPWDFPGKSTGVGCHFLLGDLPNPEIEPRSSELQADALPLSRQGGPEIFLSQFNFKSRNNCLLSTYSVKNILGVWKQLWIWHSQDCLWILHCNRGSIYLWIYLSIIS